MGAPFVNARLANTASSRRAARLLLTSLAALCSTARLTSAAPQAPPALEAAKQAPPRAEPAAAPRAAAPEPAKPPPTAQDPVGRTACSGICYLRSQVDAGMGKGVRFNNPFRLQTQLGSNAESLSLSAAYLDLRGVVLFGDPFGWHYGAAASVALAVQGVPQQVVTPAFTTGLPLSEAFWLNGFLGCPLVLGPDFNAGVELGVEVSYWPRAGWGLYTGLAWDQFWGAATDESTAASIPMLAVQAGLSLQYELLP